MSDLRRGPTNDGNSRLGRCTALVTALALSLGFAGSAAAIPVPLNPPSIAFKPDASPALPTPLYTPALPAYCTPAHLVASMTSPLTGGVTGSVSSWVYYDPATGDAATGEKTFVYQFTHSTGPAAARASLGGPYWENVTITDCGADHSGTSRPAAFAPTWTDGDPTYLERLREWGVGIQFLAQGNVGTDLNGPTAQGTSSLIFLETTRNWYALSTASTINGGQSGDGEVYAPDHRPAENIPEPAGVAVFASGLLGLLAVRPLFC